MGINPLLKKRAKARNTSCMRPVLFSVAATLSLTTVAQAQIVENVGGGERINFAGKLQMLSQRIAAAACFDHAAISSQAASTQLITASAEFTIILDALENGSDQLDIFGAEAEPLVLAEIAALSDLWTPMRDVIAEVVAVGGTDAQITAIGDQSGPLFSKSKDLVTEVSIEYAIPTALLQADAIIIGIAGRQRSLAQNISKNACLLAEGLGTETSLQEFEDAIKRYEVSAYALLNGMPDAGVHATDNPAIIRGLTLVLADWERIKPALAQIAAGGGADSATLAEIFATMNSLTSQMNSVVGVYTMDSKLDL